MTKIKLWRFIEDYKYIEFACQFWKWQFKFKLTPKRITCHFSKLWRSIGKGVLYKTIDVKVQALLCLNFDVNRFVKYSFSYGTSQLYICTKGLFLWYFFCKRLFTNCTGVSNTKWIYCQFDVLYEMESVFKDVFDAFKVQVHIFVPELT